MSISGLACPLLSNEDTFERMNLFIDRDFAFFNRSFLYQRGVKSNGLTAGVLRHLTTMICFWLDRLLVDPVEGHSFLVSATVEHGSGHLPVVRRSEALKRSDRPVIIHNP